jgi:hypothetical protein
MIMKFIESVTGIAIAAGAAIVINENHKIPAYGEIVTEGQQKNGEVMIGVITKEGGRSFANCNPQLLRCELKVNPRDLIVGKEIKHSTIEDACPSDPYLIKEAQSQKNNNK